MTITDDPIVAAAIQYRKKGEEEIHTLTGMRHSNIIGIFAEMGLYTSMRDTSVEKSGFVTKSGRFVDRVEALKIAKECHQLKWPVSLARTELYSEDLW